MDNRHNQVRQPRLQTPRLRHSLAATIMCLLFTYQGAHAVNCSVSSTPIGFGTYDVFSSSNLDTTGSVRVKCAPGNTTYTISLQAGLNGSINNRKMQNSSGNGKMNYNLYIDAARSIIWGDGTGGTVTVTNNSPKSITVYARIPAGQNVSTGSYSDSVTVLVSF